MKRLMRVVSVFGLTVLVAGIFAGCSASNDRSTPEAAMENYMATVKSGKIEKSHEFMHGAFLESYTVKEAGNRLIDEKLLKKIKSTEGYKAYQKELLNFYNQLEYEITDTHEREGFDQKEFTINLTMPSVSQPHEEAIDEEIYQSLDEAFSTENEEDLLEGFDALYSEFAKAIQNPDNLEDTVSGYIIFIQNETEDNKSKREWVISGMDYELFERLAVNKSL